MKSSVTWKNPVSEMIMKFQIDWPRLNWPNRRKLLQGWSTHLEILMLSRADNDYSNRMKNFSFGDRSLLKKVEDMAPWAFREVFRMTKRVFKIFLAECEPWLPQGLSTNGKSISLQLQVLIFLYYVTRAIPFRHLAVAAGVKKSTCQKIIQKVVNSLIDNGFVTRLITRITEVLHWLMNHVK